MNQWIQSNLSWILDGVGVTVLLALFFLGKRGLKWIAMKAVRIHIKIDPELLSQVKGFGLLIVRLGGEAGTVNKEVAFCHRNDRGALEAVARCHRSHSFTFKCFVDHAPLTYESVRDALISAGFVEVSKGEGKPNRAWFLLRDYPRNLDGRFINNEFLPS